MDVKAKKEALAQRYIEGEVPLNVFVKQLKLLERIEKRQREEQLAELEGGSKSE